jgi:hypothetical protein
MKKANTNLKNFKTIEEFFFTKLIRKIESAKNVLDIICPLVQLAAVLLVWFADFDKTIDWCIICFQFFFLLVHHLFPYLFKRMIKKTFDKIDEQIESIATQTISV